MSKTIKWKGETKGTKYGLMAKGRIIDLPDPIADSYIDQKLASEYKGENDLTAKEEKK